MNWTNWKNFLTTFKCGSNEDFCSQKSKKYCGGGGGWREEKMLVTSIFFPFPHNIKSLLFQGRYNLGVCGKWYIYIPYIDRMELISFWPDCLFVYFSYSFSSQFQIKIWFFTIFYCAAQMLSLAFTSSIWYTGKGSWMAQQPWWRNGYSVGLVSRRSWVRS